MRHLDETDTCVQTPEDEEGDIMRETGMHNTTEVTSAVAAAAGNTRHFMEVDDVRLSIAAASAYEILDKKYDVDGLAVELARFTAVTADIHYLMLRPEAGVQNVFHLVKKHASYHWSLPFSFGLHVAFAQGFRITLAVLPTRYSREFASAQSGRKSADAYLKKCVAEFRQLLRCVPEGELKRPSLRKNVLDDTHNINVLPPDQHFFMRMLDRAVAKVPVEDHVRFVKLASQFGTKCTGRVDLNETFDAEGIDFVSVHCAVELTSSEAHLLWAREGIYEVVGERGKAFHALSITEAINYQSNLDGRPMDIHADLRNVCRHPAQLTFIQLYADTPHARPELAPHPVSGKVVISCHFSCQTFVLNVIYFITISIQVMHLCYNFLVVQHLLLSRLTKG